MKFVSTRKPRNRTREIHINHNDRNTGYKYPVYKCSSGFRFINVNCTWMFGIKWSAISVLCLTCTWTFLLYIIAQNDWSSSQHWLCNSEKKIDAFYFELQATKSMSSACVFKPLEHGLGVKMGKYLKYPKNSKYLRDKT